MIDLTELQERFPHHKIRSQPAEGCGCKGTGVRHSPKFGELCCICVCLSAPETGDADYRVELGKAVAANARKALDEMKLGGQHD